MDEPTAPADTTRHTNTPVQDDSPRRRRAEEVFTRLSARATPQHRMRTRSSGRSCAA